MDQEAKYWRDKWSEANREIEALRKLLIETAAQQEEKAVDTILKS